MQVKYEHLEVIAWANAAAFIVHKAIQKNLMEHESCNIMLTGGRSAEYFYRAWNAVPDFQMLRGVNFYFGDERCVPPDDLHSNYGLVMGTLFPRGLPEHAQIFRMEAESKDIEAAADSYAAIIPQVIDVLLLGVGGDGHIASLFPHSEALDITHRLVVPVICPAPPFRRLTITPNIIQSAREVFVLALGQQKRSIYEDALCDPADIKSIPARLVLNATWIFGE